MKCITACFGSLTNHSGKNKKHHLIPPPPRKDLQSLIEKDATKEALLYTNQAAEQTQIANSAIKGKNEDQLNSSTRKKVTFDLDVKTPDPEECQIQKEAVNFPVEINVEEKPEESKVEVGQGINCGSSGEKGEETSKRAKISDEADLMMSESSVSSLFSYPPNLRYQNCASSDEDDFVGMDFKDTNLAADSESDDKNEEIDSKYTVQNGSQDTALVPEDSSESLFSLSIDSRNQIAAVENDVGESRENGEIGSNNREKSDGQDSALLLVQEESSESLFSLSIDSRKQIAALDTDVGEKEVSSPLKPPSKRGNARERSNCVQSVLNPIENLSQWNAVRAKTTPPITTDQDKENVNLEQENDTFSFWGKPTSFKKSPQQLSRRFSNRHKDDEIAVDTSLSSWLMSSEMNVTDENSPASVGNSSSKRTNTPKSVEGRQIL
ncbi:OLC1v1026551C1 [Oldenlandia corymbosa var. corymbosa]|uniref:OLC1v1026551C1 n=1 Tax=Oldenlandia corymbosa var. corymbosa TaxID=529605 RepID=A0AAV1C798_OLDCO|nr:OLC1v1026551C1 [Oldenlandia corymbosa var. corymbosa]